MLGPDANRLAADDAKRRRLRGVCLFSRADTIYAGTNEIQLNIMAERALGHDVELDFVGARVNRVGPREQANSSQTSAFGVVCGEPVGVWAEHVQCQLAQFAVPVRPLVLVEQRIAA
ncbi:hypothetical protein A6V36_38125 [Paraburkholderia ginsengiterrae]|uniref:Uncharacterized protein n=1 Tax=Paraburkholderia ginsengiterrae TaxID=1462993 RepID=A0ABX2UWU5_9BURK|nr:hypothetical protein A6V36_38125 [Paraburkholderia ginsengiterrae]